MVQSQNPPNLTNIQNRIITCNENGLHNDNGIHTNGNGSSESDLLIPSKVSKTLVFYVNGREVQDAEVDPEWTLLYYLRNKLRLYGTKLGCAEGGCGACTVMISRYDRNNDKIVHVAANACLTPVCAMHGMAVTTVEGIGSTKTKLHPVQERIAKAHGSQCGFCTPGIVMSMYSLLRSIPKPTMENLEIAFQGNLCRCTGYRPIIEGFKTFTEEWELSQRSSKISHGHSNETKERVCAMGDACCKKVFTSEPVEVFNSKEFRPYDPTQEPIFPPKLKLSAQLDEEYLIIQKKDTTWYRPNNLNDILSLKHQHPNAKIIVGNTEVGVEVKFKHLSYPVLINPFQIKEMRQVIEVKDALSIGASVTLIEMEEFLRKEIYSKPEYKTRIFRSMVSILHWFAGKQIRNVAAVGGNIMTGSPISDLNPIFLAAGIKLNLCSLKGGHRQVKMDHNFFTGYRRNVVTPDEILISIEVPYTDKDQYFIAYKQAKRRDDDIAIVNMALNVFFEPNTSTVKKSFIAYGGMAPVTKLARETCDFMVGKKWDENLLEFVNKTLISELPLSGDAPGGMILYRRSLTLSLFFKGFVSISKQLAENSINVKPLPKRLENADEGFEYVPPKSSQYFQVTPKDQASIDLIGRPIVHASAFKQATGEAIYCDDTPRLDGELYLSLVLSTKARAKIVKIDPTKALALDGVVDFICAKDIPKDRLVIGSIIHDEEIFASEEVYSQGQLLGAVVAVDQITAQKASRLVHVEYEEIGPLILTIEDAIKEKSFYPGYPKVICNGDVNKALSECDHVIEGECRMGGQEHFYLETQAAFAIPKENDEIEIISSTQHPTELQKLVAFVLQMPINKVNVRVKRLGGGFGGKESRGTLVAIPIALAAARLQRPVRCMLDRDEDMMISGGRHSFLFKYKIGFNNDGLLKAMEVHIYNNGGYSLDLSGAVLERSMFHCENGYNIPIKNVMGYVCKTNIPSNTAFRGFGGPQGMFCAENVIHHVADYLKRDVNELMELNFYKDGDITHYNQVLNNVNLQRCWDECKTSANYEERMKAVQSYNKEHRYRKRGMALVPVKFGISFTVLFLNQAGALVHIYTDGSVLISHGGIEMGQGLHTKMIQVASRILKVNPNKIHISETATDKVPNTSATAASAGSDLNGMAVMNACNKLMERLKPIMEANPTAKWEDWIKTAYLNRVGLSATGFYKTPDLGYSFETNSGMAFNYYTYGVACSEVEVDCLTGDHQVLRTDIVMDLGESLNPAIDIGQVEGGFVQGYGLFTLEELMYSNTGMMFSRGPGAYKIPGFTDIPQEFNVSLLKGATNPRAVFSSKAVGEPPLFLASSVFFAIKEAIKADRAEMKMYDYFRFDSPATAARIRMACTDNITTKIGDGDGKRAWNVVV